MEVGSRGHYGPVQVNQTVKGANDYRAAVITWHLPCPSQPVALSLTVTVIDPIAV